MLTDADRPEGRRAQWFKGRAEEHGAWTRSYLSEACSPLDDGYSDEMAAIHAREAAHYALLALDLEDRAHG